MRMSFFQPLADLATRNRVLNSLSWSMALTSLMPVPEVGLYSGPEARNKDRAYRGVPRRGRACLWEGSIGYG